MKPCKYARMQIFLERSFLIEYVSSCKFPCLTLICLPVWVALSLALPCTWHRLATYSKITMMTCVATWLLQVLRYPVYDLYPSALFPPCLPSCLSSVVAVPRPAAAYWRCWPRTAWPPAPPPPASCSRSAGWRRSCQPPSSSTWSIITACLS